MPGSGGPYVYARDAFGEFAGFLNAWSYWITAWAGNAAIVVAWVGYVEVFWNTGHTRSLVDRHRADRAVAAGAGEPGRPAQHRRLPGRHHRPQVRPAAVHGHVGLLFIKSGELRRVQRHGGSSMERDQRRRRDRPVQLPRHRDRIGRRRPGPGPRRNVGRATVLGTLACAVGLPARHARRLRHRAARDAASARTAPFTDSANAIFGGSWAGNTVAVAAIVSGFGALVGWTLIVAEMPQAAARDGCSRPAFARESRAGVPAFGIVVSTLLAAALTVVSYTSFDQVFTTIVLLSVLTSVIPYLFSAAAQLYWLVTAAPAAVRCTWRATSPCRALALVFTFWTLAGSGYQAVYYGMFCLLLGVPVYVWFKAERRVRRDVPAVPSASDPMTATSTPTPTRPDGRHPLRDRPAA